MIEERCIERAAGWSFKSLSLTVRMSLCFGQVKAKIASICLILQTSSQLYLDLGSCACGKFCICSTLELPKERRRQKSRPDLVSLPPIYAPGKSSRSRRDTPIEVTLAYLFTTEWCKSISACLNFRGLAPASLSNQPQPAKAAIFGKIGRKTINLA